MSDKDYKNLHTYVEGAVATVELARPDVHNALSTELIDELTRRFAELAKDETVRIVKLTGEGRSFCAGVDINYLRDTASFSREESIRDARQLAAMYEEIVACPKPVVARVQGAASGGGVGLVAASDIVLAAERSRFSLSTVRLGIAPATIAPYVVRKIGTSHAQALFLTGERIGAKQAKEIGLVHEVVSDEDLDAAVSEKMAALLAGAPGAQRECKDIVREVTTLDRKAVNEKMAQHIADFRSGGEGQEGLLAFLEKREPQWKENCH